MPGLGDMFQKAFYLGVGLASYAGEKANEQFKELRIQAEKLADEMVQRGEMTTEEASRFVDDIVRQAQQPTVEQGQEQPQQPRSIEILDDDEEDSGTTKPPDEVDHLRDQVKALQDELRRLQQ
ncbi:hypothetical protein PN462_05730 [Spirulina sp. CS-785/01]|uniref:phasin family protein n=1 Tax=Spirulina sp. CS-785/01 TaxID=3021716 RepID=UPI00232D42BB|nr:hypothetical protein [Spirulina sp. CS-785/01]MDB9312596.1 hypothetical protein [Spirulina sp. CS-785/01]